MALAVLNEADLLDGFLLSVGTLAMTVVLELTSISTVRGLCQQAGGTRLYAMGVAMNVINLATAALTYGVAVPLLCTPHQGGVIARVCSVLVLLATQAVVYWAVHRLMHTRHFYWMHRFHHRFNKHVPPSAANAVSLAEFNLAYSAPFILGGLVFPVERWVLKVAVAINYLASALVHTPWLQRLSQEMLPWFLVSTHDHMEHHRLLNSHYASPTINMDKLVEWFFAECARPAVTRCSSTPRARLVTSPCHH